METKQWYLSKTLWGALLAGVAGLLGVFGFTTDPEFVQSGADTAVAIAGIVGAGVAAWGRIVATSKLVKKK